MMQPLIKICGLSTPEALEAALDAGADMAGFVFFAPSPRNVPLEAARMLGARVEGRAQKVSLTVDADDDFLAAVIAALAPDILQLHGKETPARAAEIAAKFRLPVMKAIGISSAADLAAIPQYEGAADRLLFDARPPKDATRPGGNGLAFDWALLKGISPAKPWMLSGGLTPDNAAAALRETRAPGLDVSSGVESAPGVKDIDRIEDFMARARAAAAVM